MNNSKQRDVGCGRKERVVGIEKGCFTVKKWRIGRYTFLTLIPKKEGGKEVGDFRPIRLLSRAYKMLAKMLANRLKLVMGSLILDYQMAGVEDKHIQENVLIADELIGSRLKNKRPGLVYKIDFSKAFDHVSWECLDYLMERFGFGLKWRG